MAAVNPYQVYRAQQVNTASPAEQVLMLMNGCARFIVQAQQAIHRRDVQGANESIQRAQDIVEALRGNLDKGYDLALQMDRLYEYMLHRLMEANLAKDTGMLEEVCALMIELKETWVQAMGSVRSGEIRVHG